MTKHLLQEQFLCKNKSFCKIVHSFWFFQKQFAFVEQGQEWTESCVEQGVVSKKEQVKHKSKERKTEDWNWRRNNACLNTRTGTLADADVWMNETEKSKQSVLILLIHVRKIVKTVSFFALSPKSRSCSCKFRFFVSVCSGFWLYAAVLLKRYLNLFLLSE